MIAKLILIRIILLYVGSLFSANLYSQNLKKMTDFLDCRANILYEDSDIILIPELKQKNNNYNVKLFKSPIFDDGNNKNQANYRFFLQKEIRGFFVNVFVDGLKQLSFNNEAYILVDFNKKKLSNYKVNLKYYYPFEIGSYRIKVQIDYFFKNKKLEVESDWTEFKVTTIPKNSLYNN